MLQIYYGQDFFSCNIFNEHFYRVPHFWPQRSHYPLFAFENYFWKYKTENMYGKKNSLKKKKIKKK